ncbi:MAG TPA: hypothetical protein VKE70_30350 [Candidatus Solibacter sp.]|nr:hypothetical protein [Candidatus Solibacter sp.]
MFAAEPKVAGARCRILRNRWHFIRALLFWDRQQPINLARVEAGEAEIEIRGAEFLQLQREEFRIPIRPRDGAVDHEPERLHLLGRPLVTEEDGNLGDTELACRLQT